MSAILSVSNLRKSYGSHKAVDGISFSVTRGGIMGLLGPNGAGKTTTIRMAMGILPVDDGEITFCFNGQNGPLEKTRVGYLPEERGLYEDVKVLDNLVFLAGLKGMPRKEATAEAKAWLKRLDLEACASKKVEKLSKGMQQKVQFIASILHHPQLVLFDEPFSGLDPVNQDFIKNIIRELQAEGVTIILSAHQMNLVEELCDSIFLINRGREILSGNLQEIKSGYKENVVELRYAPSGDVSFLERIPGMRVLRIESGAATLRYGGSIAMADLLKELSTGLDIEEISVRKPPLHEIFIETTKERGEYIDE